ncbi:MULTISPECIES: OmpA family protein [Corallincola]|uniref:OmpA family protein n=3 Tax=Corallincola TaxID=1775176 RepID=A0A368NQH0_9GAMM|nr:MULTISPECIES: OmpA family protein [Corallincola]RCU52648.1 OmpA family protein [Corallincola holothuriorum]TAA48171.1 OmpA family protein [Corallincola spongiicola]TCI03146.1 OmpA family protein [Corallincola luteus]
MLKRIGERVLIVTGLMVGLVAGSVAEDGPIDAAEAYVLGADGMVVLSGTGACVRHSGWSEEKAKVVGCDGYALSTDVEFVKGEGDGLITGLSLPQAELFAFDSAEMGEEGKAYLLSRKAELSEDFNGVYSVTVIGHTDSTGDETYNQDLSLRRANAVGDYLKSIGVPEGRLNTLGRGENDPLVTNDTVEGRAQNRRVEVFVVGELRALDRLVFPSIALFERRKGELTGEGVGLMRTHIEEARELLRSAAFIEIVGHTDDVGDDDYNMALSVERAESVGLYLIEAGVDSSKIVMRGAGETMPVATNATEPGKAQNRRVEVLIFGRGRF